MAKFKNVTGYKTKLLHRNLWYVRERYWYYMKYTTPRSSMSLRAIARKSKNLGKIFMQLTYNEMYR